MSVTHQAEPGRHSDDVLEELKRRKVVRVLLVYLASAFAVLEAADIVVEALSLPPWLLRAMIAIVMVGLPVALVLSWVYDLTPTGVVHTDGESASAPETSAPGETASSSWLSLGSFAFAALLLAAGATGRWLFESIAAGSGVDAPATASQSFRSGTSALPPTTAFSRTACTRT